MKTILIAFGDERAEFFMPIYDMLDAQDPASAQEQLNKNYPFGGYQPIEGFKFHNEGELEIVYPGDPPLRPRAVIIFRLEMVVIYPHDWVMVMQEDSSFVIARMT